MDWNELSSEEARGFMRFYADGPSIPDELLIARDEGRVVFFCGAGVSKERAGLPLFSNWRMMLSKN